MEAEFPSTVEILAVAGEREITLLAYNHDLIDVPISEEEVCIKVKGAEPYRRAIITRIDENSANPKKKWIELGSPEYPSAEEIELIYQASVPQRSKLFIKNEQDEYIVTFTIPPHGVAAIIFTQ